MTGGDLNTAVSTVTAADHDLVESRTGTITGAPLTTDPGLGSLAANGGPTQTMAITATSPAFGTGATPLSTDQRGTARPQGAADDIGAFELEVVAPQPTVTTGAATAVGTTGATLNSTINPNGSSTTYRYEYGRTTSFGTVVGDFSAGSGSIAVAQPGTPITGLAPATTYYYRVAGFNAAPGQALGAVVAFTTTGGPTAPTATTAAATAIANTGVTLNGTANAHGSPTAYAFEWGTTTAFGNITPVQNGGSTAADFPVTAALSGLAPRQTYFYRLVASNAQGTTTGSVMAFTTTGPATAPTVTTGPASLITATGATLSGTVNPRAGATTFTFEYGTTTSFGDISAVDNAGSGGSTLSVSLPITGLSPGTTYLYRLVASNATGTTAGSVQAFATPPAP